MCFLNFLSRSADFSSYAFTEVFKPWPCARLRGLSPLAVAALCEGLAGWVGLSEGSPRGEPSLAGGAGAKGNRDTRAAA